jgi:two-component system, NarL family, response regulator NreC
MAYLPLSWTVVLKSIYAGIEAARQNAAACPQTRIITLSIYHTGEYVQRAINAGAFGHVLKDAAGHELIEAVRTLHAGKRYFSPQFAK